MIPNEQHYALADVLEQYAKAVKGHLKAPGDATAMWLEYETEEVMELAQRAKGDSGPDPVGA